MLSFLVNTPILIATSTEPAYPPQKLIFNTTPAIVAISRNNKSLSKDC